MTDSEKLKKKLKEITVPFEVHIDGEYEDITISSNASDNCVSLTFKDGKYVYRN